MACWRAANNQKHIIIWKHYNTVKFLSFISLSLSLFLSPILTWRSSLVAHRCWSVLHCDCGASLSGIQPVHVCVYLAVALVHATVSKFPQREWRPSRPKRPHTIVRTSGERKKKLIYASHLHMVKSDMRCDDVLRQLSLCVAEWIRCSLSLSLSLSAAHTHSFSHIHRSNRN